MGFWRGLLNFIDRQIEADRERNAIERERRGRLSEIRAEERERELGRIEARHQTYRDRDSRPSDFWNVPVPTSRETRDAWFGEPERRKKKRDNNSFW